MLYHEKDKTSDADHEEVPLVRHRRPMQRLVGDFSLSSYLTDTATYQRLGAENTPPALQLIELRHVGIWICALVTITASVCVGLVSVAMPYVLPVEGKSALRNLIVSALIGAALQYKPCLVHTGGVVQQTVPPLRHLHKSLRNCIVCILSAWCVEALQDSSCTEHVHEIGVLRHSAMVLVFVAMFSAACCRAMWPQEAGDVHVCVALASLVTLVCLPQTQFWAGNPLAKQLGFADGAVRTCRILVFAITYCGVVIAATPMRVLLVDPLVLSVRAFAASAWLLACPPQLIMLGPVYCTVLCLRRVGQTSTDANGDADNDTDTEQGGVVTDGQNDESASPLVVEGRLAGTARTHRDADVRGTYVSKAGAGVLSDDRKKILLAKLNGNVA